MIYRIDPGIFEKFPDFRRVVVLANNIDNQGEKPELLALLRSAEEKVRGETLADFPDLPRLSIWLDAFRSLSINPKKHPPSVVNMIKRVRGGKDLPYISNMVAIFNYMSLSHLLSCGGDDLSVVKGDLALTLADGSENYSPLGQPEVREHPAPGEVVYLDTATKEVFCRAWCWKNGDVSKISPATKQAAMNIDGMLPAFTLDELESLGHQAAELLARFTGAETEVKIMSPQSPEFIIQTT